MGKIDDTLAGLGIALPVPAAPVANYVPFVLSGRLLTVSGQLAFGTDGKLAPAHRGKLGGEVSRETGQDAARLCAINVLAQVKVALGDLDRVSRCVRLGGFINAQPDFIDLPVIMNGASDLMVAVFGDKGRHARSTIGVATLPMGCAVEVEATFEVD
jgi:enamine deaminase RidA (YjgF/YER057c/UK114 family)